VPNWDWNNPYGNKFILLLRCIFITLAKSLSGDNLISWSIKRQPTLSRPNVESEYRAVGNVLFESCLLKNLLLEPYCHILKATLVYCDNISSSFFFSNLVQHQCIKHIEMIFILCVRKLLLAKFVCYICSFTIPNRGHLH